MRSFLERLGEFKSAYEVSDEAMLRAVPELLKGQALLWFRNNQSTWEDFLISIKDSYLPVDRRCPYGGNSIENARGRGVCF
jgi:hypothetical protein